MALSSCSVKKNYICSNHTQKSTKKHDNLGYCQTGFFKFQNFCYKLNLKCRDPTYTWTEAQTYCSKLNSSLVVIESFIEEEFITALMTTSPQPSWTGLIHKNLSPNISIWIDNSSNVMPTYSIKFKSGEPNGYRTRDEHCLMIYNRLSNIGYFNDEVCNKSMNFICKTPAIEGKSMPNEHVITPHPLFMSGRCRKDFYEFNETCYSLQNLNKSFEESKTHCKGKLLQVYNNIHIAFIRSLMVFTGVSDLWLSVFDAGKINGAMWLLNETKSTPDAITPDGFYYMSTQQGLPTAKSSDDKYIGTSCYYYLDSHEEESEDLICPLNWKKVGQKCFKFHSEMLQFNESRSLCKALNAELAILTNMKEVQAVNFLIESDSWIGVDGQSYLDNVWINGTKLDYCLFRHTTDLETHIKKDPKDVCFIFRKDKSEWDDKKCEESYMSVCEMRATKNECPKEFSILVDGDCYGAMQEELTWSKAEEYCHKNGGKNSHLTSFHSMSQENHVFSEITDNKEYWIGLKKWDTIGWIDGSVLNYQRDYIEMYNDFKCFSSEKTKSVAAVSSRWNKENCQIRKKFICKISNTAPPGLTTTKPDDNFKEVFCPSGFITFKKSCFKFINDTLKWLDADKYCTSKYRSGNMSARLASFESGEEFAFVLSNLRDIRSPVWIGMYKDDKTEQLVWIDEKPVFFTKWSLMENDNTFIKPGNHTVISVSGNPFKNGKWSRASSLTNLPFICRVDPRETHDTEVAQEKCADSHVKYNGHCYFFNTKLLTFQEAYDACIDSELVVLGDTFEEYFLLSYAIGRMKSSSMIWMGFKVDNRDDMMMNWVTPKKDPVYYTHWKDLLEGNKNGYSDESPKSLIYGCYAIIVKLQSNIDKLQMNSPMITVHCDIKMPSVCKSRLRSDKGTVSDVKICAMSRNNFYYKLNVVKTKNGNPCIRWDLAQTNDQLQYHLQTFLYSSVPINRDGYISYSLNRCSELSNGKSNTTYNCYVFKRGQYILEECEMQPCNPVVLQSKKTPNRTILVILFILTSMILTFSVLFLFRQRILSNYRVRSFLAQVLGRFQPAWLVDSHRPHTSASGGVGFSNPVYTPLDSKY